MIPIRKIQKIFCLFFLLALPLVSSGSELTIQKIEPSSWWTGMEYNSLQLLVYGKDLSSVEVESMSNFIRVKKIHYVENKNYLFLDINILPEAVAGEYNFVFRRGKEKVEMVFPIYERSSGSDRHQGFDSRDVIYLLMPDRFANAIPENDNIPGMIEQADRQNPDGRHGGDIQGIKNNLDYIADMGFTALWINPMMENNMPEYSYHGYAITDYYKTDPRYGSNEDYKNLVDEAHNKGIKVIMDMVFNHCGTEHWFIKDLPMNDWIHQWDTLTKSNFRGEVSADPYKSEYDLKLMNEGWFDNHMADLNQANPFVFKYLVQNSIWWIEYAGIDAIRMDTYPYPQKEAMAEWAKLIKELYPNFTVLGEVWLQKPSQTAYWQHSGKNHDSYQSHVPVVTDFPLHYAIAESMNEEEGWTQGLRRIYYILSQDFLYPDPHKLVFFGDNHDVNRLYSSLNEDFRKYKIAMAFVATSRRIPQVYYGTEILTPGEKGKGDAYLRTDFPGGWEGDSVNAFTGKGLNDEQLEAQAYLKNLLNWRKENNAVINGELIHFIPEDDTYVYFRISENERVMVILNKNEEEFSLKTDRFIGCLDGYWQAKNVISDDKFIVGEEILLAPVSVTVLELTPGN